ncbi:MAG: 2-dehydropantoate 2-reductase [Synergistaceae bacterium]|jgi:2-dehydropantoate 2-reductase|nr:2-dehydropantoate 2-reductase [Synergistaceae bacterium]
MKIVVVGLGGVGGVVGGNLASDPGPNSVVFWCRGETLRAISEHGIRVLSDGGDISAVPALATHDAREVLAAVGTGGTGAPDVIIFAVKGYQLEQAASEVRELVGARTVIIPLLNGVGASDAIQAIIPQACVLGGCVYVSAHSEGPGVVRQVGSAQRVFFGAREGAKKPPVPLADVETALRRGRLDVILTDKIDVEVWSKFAFLSPFAGVTTLFGRTIGSVLADGSQLALAREMIGEVAALARAKGVALPGDIEDVVMEKARSFPPATKTSMQIDRECGAPIEIDTLIKYVADESAVFGLSTPAYDRVYSGLIA